VSLEAVPELLEFSETTDLVRIGAALSLSEIERRWTNPPHLVRQWWPLFASLAIRNRATLEGTSPQRRRLAMALPCSSRLMPVCVSRGRAETASSPGSIFCGLPALCFEAGRVNRFD